MTVETLEKILSGGGDVMPDLVGKHPDYDGWPEEAKFPIIGGVQWMLTTDGCYFVRMDGRGMLVPARHHCWHLVHRFCKGIPVDDICGAPIHPADVRWKESMKGEVRSARCRVHSG